MFPNLERLALRVSDYREVDVYNKAGSHDWLENSRISVAGEWETRKEICVRNFASRLEKYAALVNIPKIVIMGNGACERWLMGKEMDEDAVY